MSISLNYIEKGAGDALILLHGNGEDYSIFENQIDEFAKYYHVFALDTRGHGKSPRGDKPFTISQFADDLRDFMDEQGIDKANILGFSDGGNIAMLFAINYPERVNKLILNGANYETSGVKKYFQLIVDASYHLMKPFENKNEKLKKKREMLRLMVKDPVNSPIELSLIKAKTLVIAGSRDLIKESHTKAIANGITNSELCIISGSHSVARTNPKEYNKAVLGFLGKDDD